MPDTFTDADLDQWLTIADVASQADWDVGHSCTETLEAATAYMAESIAKSDKPDLWMVCFGERDEHDIMEDAQVVAYTGNGTHSEANAYFVAACKPSHIRTLIYDLKHARSEIKRLTYILNKAND